MKTYRKLIEQELKRNNWEIILVYDQEEWWLREYWVISSQTNNFGLQLYISFLTDPSGEKPMDKLEITEIVVSSKKLESRIDNSARVSALCMQKGNLNKKLLELMNQLNKYREKQ